MVNGDPSSTKTQSAFWKKMWQQPKKWYWFGIPLGGLIMFIAGIFVLGGFNATMALTNSVAFCTSCHEMTPVANEWEQSPHYSNASGVRAICSDCHVPKRWDLKVLRKSRATLNEIPHWLLGTIDTPEKFEARRAEMAENVWAEMRANDSRECRNCHSWEAMNLDEQDKSARRKHTQKRRDESGETCIDCHQGIAHKLPNIDN